MKKGERTDLLVGQIREAIISGDLLPGQVLRQDALAATYGASRMPIREALRTLAAEGLIALHPNRGALVMPMNRADCQEIFEMRAIAEGLALRLAVPHLSNAQIDHAAAINSALNQAPPGDFSALNLRFHQTLYAPCARPRLLAHIASLHGLSERYIRYTIWHLGYHTRSAADHQALLESCTARDAAAAERLIMEHIHSAGAVLDQHLQAQTPQ